MAQNAQIKIFDGKDTVYLYKPTKGNPKGCFKELFELMQMIIESKISNENVADASNWLLEKCKGAYEVVQSPRYDVKWFYTLDLQEGALITDQCGELSSVRHQRFTDWKDGASWYEKGA